MLVRALTVGRNQGADIQLLDDGMVPHIKPIAEGKVRHAHFVRLKAPGVHEVIQANGSHAISRYGLMVMGVSPGGRRRRLFPGGADGGLFRGGEGYRRHYHERLIRWRSLLSKYPRGYAVHFTVLGETYYTKFIKMHSAGLLMEARADSPFLSTRRR